MIRLVLGMIIALSLSVSVDARTIAQMKIEGNKRIDHATIIANLGIQAGEDHEAKDIDDALKRLFETGFFEDVRFRFDANTLVITVVENPVVNRIGIEGNNKIDDDIITPRLELKPRQVYTLAKLKHDTQAIQDLYRLKGFFAASVTPKIVKKDQNRVDVVFEVNEGVATVVRRINFIGNKAFSESKLESVIQTKETRWYRFFSSDDNYDQDRLAYDRELLRKFYLERGYLDFKVKSAVAELTPDRKEFFITFSLDEGPRYKVGNITVRTTMKNVTEADLLKQILLKKGDWYSSKTVNDSNIKISDFLGNKGYAFVDVLMDTNKQAGNVVDLVFEVAEGPSVYIDQIIIKGNTRTNDDVIRREMLVFEGDPYNTAKIRETERRIKNLGFFKKVEIHREPSNQPDKVNIIVEIEEEASTGELSFMFGYNTEAGVLGGVSASERNLFGQGKGIGIGFTASKRTQEVTLDYSHPNFTNRPITAGISLELAQERGIGTSGSSMNQGYRARRVGADFYLDYELTKDLYQRVTYGISDEKRSKLFDTTISEFIRNEKRNIFRSFAEQRLLWDRTDNRQDPTEGYDISLRNRLYGLGGDVRHLDNVLATNFYYPVMEQVVFHANARGGKIMKMGKYVPINDRHVLGGYSFRGFEFEGVTVRDKAKSDYSLRGFNFYAGTFELKMPLPLVPQELGMKFKTFMDFGAVWGSGFPKDRVDESKKPRMSAGFGVSVKTPMGNVGVDFAWPIRRARFDERRSFLLQFGNQI